MIRILGYRPPEGHDLSFIVLQDNESITLSIGLQLHAAYLREVYSNGGNGGTAIFETGIIYEFRNGLNFRVHDGGLGSLANRRFTMEVRGANRWAMSSLPQLVVEAMCELPILVRRRELDEVRIELEKLVEGPERSSKSQDGNA
jgi:hypothetical protein